MSKEQTHILSFEGNKIKNTDSLYTINFERFSYKTQNGVENAIKRFFGIVLKNWKSLLKDFFIDDYHPEKGICKKIILEKTDASGNTENILREWTPEEFCKFCNIDYNILSSIYN